MSKASIILRSSADRLRAVNWVRQAPDFTTVEFRENKRTIPQNDRMWATLTQIAAELRWHGHKLGPNQWKLVFMSGLNSDMQIVPNYEGDGFIMVGGRSSKLTIQDMSDLIEIINEFAARNGVSLNEPKEVA